MSVIIELYQQLIIDHGRRPRNVGELAEANYIKDGYNPLCGDQLRVYVKAYDGVIEAVQFTGQGCAISTASASLMTQCLVGKTVEEADAIFKAFHVCATEGADPSQYQEILGKLVVLTGVSEFPARVKCATLAWHTLQAALHDNQDCVSTE